MRLYIAQMIRHRQIDITTTENNNMLTEYDKTDEADRQILVSAGNYIGP